LTQARNAFFVGSSKIVRISSSSTVGSTRLRASSSPSSSFRAFADPGASST
jgi:hypothetical protein